MRLPAQGVRAGGVGQDVLHGREHAEHPVLLGPQDALGHQLLPDRVQGVPRVQRHPDAPPVRKRLGDQFEETVEHRIPGPGVQVDRRGDAVVVGQQAAPGQLGEGTGPHQGGQPGRVGVPGQQAEAGRQGERAVGHGASSNG